MAGVIGTDGIQWERCNGCGDWEEFDFLGYEQPSTRFPYGRDLCRACVRDPEGMEARRISVLARDDQERAEYDATVFPTLCGHGQVPGKTVYDFQQEASSPGVESFKVLTYCSQACKDEASKGGDN